MKGFKKWRSWGLRIGIGLGAILLLASLVLAFGLPNYQIKHSPNAKLKITASEKGYQLSQNDQALFIKGAAGEGHLIELQNTGGNTLRLYDYFVTDSLLTLADSLGINIILDLDLPRVAKPFDYHDVAKVDSLVEAVKSNVRSMMHHPSIVVWNIGNEICPPSWKMAAPWRTIGRIAQELKSLDPSRLTSTAIPLHPTPLIQARMFANELDFLSINAFKLTLSITPYWEYCLPCWDGPYLYSEIGPMGTWQVEANDWNVHQEWSDRRKTEYLAYMYEHFLPQEPNCLGSCAFFWGFKQERTHTWYSLFSDQGEKTPMIDELEKVWQGKYPNNRAPIIENLKVSDAHQGKNVTLKADSVYQAIVHITDPENDTLSISWEIYHEGDYRHKFNGEGENRPQALTGLILSSHDSIVEFKVPDSPGDYRLFVYARDGHNNFGSFNIPFFVVLDTY